MAKKIDVYFDAEKLARVAVKNFRLLVKKTRNPCEAYAVLLILKKSFELEYGLIEAEFKPVVDGLSDST